jgi:hypothetical protein
MGAVSKPVTIDRTTTPTAAINKGAMVYPMRARTEKPRVGTEDRKTLTLPRNRVMVNPMTVHTEKPRVDTENQKTLTPPRNRVMVNPMTVHTETPEVATGNRTTANKVATVSLRVDRTKTLRVATAGPRADPTKILRVATDDLTTPMGVIVVVMANLTHTEVVSKVTVNLTITLALMVNRRSGAVVGVIRSCISNNIS